MKHPLIERKLATLESIVISRSRSPMLLENYWEFEEKTLIDLFTTALEEALLAGIEMAESVVPEEIEIGCHPHAVEYFNKCRTEILSRLAALKESVGKV